MDRLEDMFLYVDRNVSLKYTSFLDASQVAQMEIYLKSIKKTYPQVEYLLGRVSTCRKKDAMCI